MALQFRSVHGSALGRGRWPGSLGDDRAGRSRKQSWLERHGGQPPAPPLPPFPRKLSETGVFTSVVNHQVAPGVIPYEINAPFWSDGAHKERFFALPDEGKIAFHDDKPWEFEDGAVTVKSFSLD